MKQRFLTNRIASSLCVLLFALGLFLLPHFSLADTASVTSTGSIFCQKYGDGSYQSCSGSLSFSPPATLLSTDLITLSITSDSSANNDASCDYGATWDIDLGTSTVATGETPSIGCGPGGGQENFAIIQLSSTTDLFAGDTYTISLTSYGLQDASFFYLGSPLSIDYASSIGTISSLGQYKSDATTTLSEGSTTMENTIVIGGTPESSSSDSFSLQVELSTSTASSSPFANPIIVTSTPVGVGQAASVTIAGLADGDYHWQAQLVDASTSATSFWQTESSPATSTDFTVHQVPLVTQTNSDWAGTTYASGTALGVCGETIGECGCAISSIVMIAQYYGIATGTDGNSMTPLSMNSWLEQGTSTDSLLGYDSHGNLLGPEAAKYAQDFSNDEGLRDDGFLSSNATSTLNEYLGLLEPVILKIVRGNFEHFIVANDELASTYGINDPYYYLTNTLNEPTSTLVYDYGNSYQNLILYTKESFDPSSTTGVAQQGVEIHLGSPGELLITDPDGNQLGINPITSTTYNNISGGVYTTEGISPGGDTNPTSTLIQSKVAWIPDPIDGNYDVQVIGTGSGGYTLQTLAYDASGTAHMETAVGSTTPNQIDSYNLDFTPDDPDSIALTPSSSTSTPPTFIQGAANDAWNEDHVAVHLESSTVEAGDVIAADVFVGQQGTTLDSVTASCVTGDFTLVNNSTTYGTASYSAMAYGIVSDTSSTCWVGAHLSAPSGHALTLVAHDIRGLATSSPLDASAMQSQSYPGTGTNAVTSGNITTTQNNDYLFGVTNNASNDGGFAPTAGTGYTLRAYDENGPQSEDAVQSSAGSVAATFTSTDGGYASYLTGIMAFKAANPGSAPTPPGSLSVGSPTTSTLSLSWASSTPSASATISFYAIYRGTSTSTMPEIATTTSLSFTDTGLATSTSYYYYLTAHDSEGNVSAPSGIASGMTTSGIIPAPAFVQGTSTDAWNVSSFSLTLSSGTVNAGDVIAADVLDANQSSTLTSVTASCVSGDFTLVDNPTLYGAVSYAAMGYGVVSNTSSTCTVTATFSGPSGGTVAMAAHEITGISTSDPLDASAMTTDSYPGTGTNGVTSGNITTTHNGDYLFGVTNNGGGNSGWTPSVGTGFTEREYDIYGPQTEDAIQASATTTAATFTSNLGYDSDIAGIMAFTPEGE